MREIKREIGSAFIGFMAVSGVVSWVVIICGYVNVITG